MVGYTGSSRPHGSNADEWNLFLDQNKDAPEFAAVQISEAIEEAMRDGPDKDKMAAYRDAPIAMMREAAQTKTRADRLEEASEIVAAAIYNARPYPRSWGEHKGVTGGGLHDHFMKEGRRIVHGVLRCLDERNSIPE